MSGESAAAYLRIHYSEARYFATSFSAVVAFLMVAVMPIAFSRSAPENADSLIFVRQSQ